MAYQKLITADFFDMDVFSNINDSYVMRSSEQARTGSYSFRFSGPRSSEIDVNPSLTTVGVACGFYSTEGAANPTFMLELNGNSNYHAQIRCNGNTKEIDLYIKDVGTVDTGGTWSINRWHYLSFVYYLHDTSGFCKVYLDDQLIIDYSGDTKGSSTTPISRVDVAQVNWDGMTYVDDIKIRDDSAPGPGGLEVMVPTEAGSYAAWTPSAGTPYECVDETPPSWSDYIYKYTQDLNQKHTFGHGGMQSLYESIPCVSVVTASRMTGNTGRMRVIAENNGTMSYGTPNWLAYGTTVSQYHWLNLQSNPATGTAWAQSGVDTLEFGIETI